MAASPLRRQPVPATHRSRGEGVQLAQPHVDRSAVSALGVQRSSGKKAASTRRSMTRERWRALRGQKIRNWTSTATRGTCKNPQRPSPAFTMTSLVQPASRQAPEIAGSLVKSSHKSIFEERQPDKKKLHASVILRRGSCQHLATQFSEGACTTNLRFEVAP